MNAQNVDMERWDPKNPLNGVSGIPVNMTCFASRLAEAGYNHRTYAGKADFGMAYARQTPKGRGYTDTLHYFQHMNDYWSLNVGNCGTKTAPIWTRDLWGTNADGTEGPQYQYLNRKACWVQNMPVNFLQNTILDRTHCIAQLRLGSSFLLSVLRFLDR